MSRSVATHDTAEEDFAAFLERLTGHSGPEREDRDSGVYFTSSTLSGKAPNSVSRSDSGGRSKSRPLAPARELKAGRDASSTDGAALSYEKALRMHARNRSTPDDDLPQAYAPGNDSRNDDAVKVDPVRVARSKSKTAPKKQRATTARKSKAAKPTEGPVQARITPKAKSSRASSGVPSSSSTSKSVELSANRTRRTLERASEKYSLELPRHELHLDHRRAVVSVRLTEVEIAQLRDRAGESGISVSAYMRSCVLDAEILRAQVKQALAEMRAFSAKPEHEGFAALATNGSTGSAHGRAWYQSLLESASALLAPLFPFRRSA
jgi:hypothetical protein